MNKNQYKNVYNNLLNFFVNDEEITDALKFINDAVKLNQNKIFNNKQQTSSEKSFSLPSSLKDKSKSYAIFSDGACRGNPGPGAWGTVVQNSSEKIIATLSGIDFRTTNNRMELQGAIEGLQELINQLGSTSKSSEVFLYSDSKYLVDGMNKWIKGWKKRNWKKADKKEPENLELWKSLDTLQTHFKTIHFNWVKGHAGHPQNEYCDELANRALDDAGC